MKFLLGLVTALAVLYGGYWFVGQRAVERGAAAAFDQMAADGWEATHAGISTIGFPSRFDTTVTAPRLVDMATGVGWEAPWIQVFALSYLPNEVIALFPEEQAIRRIEHAILSEWTRADQAGERYFPHEFMYRILLSGALEPYYQIDPKDSWMLAAAQKNLPIIVPGWEDSTTGNIFAGHVIEGDITNVHTVRSGIEYMMYLADWYTRATKDTTIGFFQIGGGIAGDFPICVVPMLHQDLRRSKVPLWGYFCQISDSTTSYGSYSGATPNEKITWGKLGPKTPRFIVQSDATIVAPLMFTYIMAS